MFKIIHKTGAVMNHQMTKEIAGSDARQIMQSNIKAETAKITNGWFNGRIDVNSARKSLKDYQRNFDRTAPESLTDETKNSMWKRAKQLKDEFIVGMLSTDELHPVKGLMVDGSMKYVADYEKINASRAVERNTSWYRQNEKKLAEFKNIMRHLNPDNPMASDIERFRPQRKTV